MVKEDQYLNLFGLFEKSPTSSSADIYAGVKAKYPVSSEMSCEQIGAIAKNVQNEVDAIVYSNTQSVSKSTHSANATAIDSYNNYLNDVKAVYNNKNCDDVIAEQQKQTDLNTELDQLKKVSSLGKSTSKMTTYVVLGMLGLIVLVTGVVLLKKSKK